MPSVLGGTKMYMLEYSRMAMTAEVSGSTWTNTVKVGTKMVTKTELLPNRKEANKRMTALKREGWTVSLIEASVRDDLGIRDVLHLLWQQSAEALVLGEVLRTFAPVKQVTAQKSISNCYDEEATTEDVSGVGAAI